jgi:hypothetical protein
MDNESEIHWELAYVCPARSELGIVEQGFHPGLSKDQPNHCLRVERWDLREEKGQTKGTLSMGGRSGT